MRFFKRAQLLVHASQTRTNQTHYVKVAFPFAAELAPTSVVPCSTVPSSRVLGYGNKTTRGEVLGNKNMETTGLLVGWPKLHTTP